MKRHSPGPSHLPGWTRLGRNEKLAALPKRQKDISHIQVCVPLLQCKPNAVVSSPITHLCAKIGALDPGPLRLASNNRNSCLEILDAESYYDPKGPFIHRDYPFLNIIFSRLSRIIVDIITSSSSLPDSKSSWALECKNLNFTIRLAFLYANTWAQSCNSKAGKIIEEGNQIASVPVTSPLGQKLSSREKYFAAQIEKRYLLPETDRKI